MNESDTSYQNTKKTDLNCSAISNFMNKPLTLEEKIKLYLAGVSSGISESAGCNDGEDATTNELINDFFSLSDEQFKEYCLNTLPRIVAYGG